MTVAGKTRSLVRERWLAVRSRDARRCAPFVYAVVTTGVYCRPDCASRRPNRANVRFFDSGTQAESNGFRACRKCRPDRVAEPGGAAARIRDACRMLASPHGRATVEAVARSVGLPEARFRRLFRQAIGVSPKQYQSAVRRLSFQENLMTTPSVTRAIFESGFQSSSRVYDQTRELLGMSPGDFRRAGRQQTIRYSTATCPLGDVLVAVTERGVCAIFLGDDSAELVDQLAARFRSATIVADDALGDVLRIVVNFVRRPAASLALPLDVQGTAFQQQVWEALQRIPPGQTRSYQQIARELGCPRSVRAVAQACAANRHAIAIPCHRAVGATGRLTGYRWGLERKRALLESESR